MFQWFFNRQPSPPSAEKRLLEAEVRLETLERELKNLRLEWEESYDKLHHLMSRVTKRAKDLQRAQNAQEEAPEAPESTNGDEPRGQSPFVGMHGMLQEARRRHGLLQR